jgi:hypothetical protein
MSRTPFVDTVAGGFQVAKGWVKDSQAGASRAENSFSLRHVLVHDRELPGVSTQALDQGVKLGEHRRSQFFIALACLGGAP